MPRTNAGLCVALILVVSVVGCSSQTAGQKAVYKVTGKVTMSGGPVANAMVTFSPKENQPVATGRTDAQGAFTMTTYTAGDGAAAGEYIVLVTKELASSASSTPLSHDQFSKGGTAPTQAHGGGAPAKAHGGAAPAQTNAGGISPGNASSALPTKYAQANQSDLKAKVVANGKNDFPLELKP